MERRAFLTGAGAVFVAGLAPRAGEALERAEQVFGSACKFADGGFGIAIVDETGALIASEQLPLRGHGIAQSARTGMIAAFARRPGTFALLLDREVRRIATIRTPADRHFYGHGLFSPDGKFLFATENDFANGRGIIGMYETAPPYRRIGEFASGGLGPHDMLAVGGGLIAIANGGIETHPDSGRDKLNLQSMDPNIAWVRPETGELIATRNLPEGMKQLSLRHLAPAGGTAVWIGGQYQGSDARQVPLLAHAAPGHDIAFPELPDRVTASLKNYVGSIASSPDGSLVSITSPVGGVSVFYDSWAMQADTTSLGNAMGTAWREADFVQSTGDGIFVDENGSRRVTEIFFDNHLVALQGRS